MRHQPQKRKEGVEEQTRGEIAISVELVIVGRGDVTETDS